MMILSWAFAQGLTHQSGKAELAPRDASSFLQVDGAARSEQSWVNEMLRNVQESLVEAHDLEASLKPKTGNRTLSGSSLLREFAVKDIAPAMASWRRSVLRSELEGSTSCTLAVLIADPASLDLSSLCLWGNVQSDTGVEASKPNGADSFSLLRSSHPAAAWAARDAVQAEFAARFHDGSANEGYYPTTWHWLARNPAASASTRRLLQQQSANSSRSGSSGGSSAGVLAVEGLVATKTMCVFEPGAMNRGVRLFSELYAPQARSVPGAVAAVALHDPALNKVLWLMLWRSDRERDAGERMLANVLNVSRVLEPVLAEPLSTERWPNASIYWSANAR